MLSILKMFRFFQKKFPYIRSSDFETSEYKISLFLIKRSYDSMFARASLIRLLRKYLMRK